MIRFLLIFLFSFVAVQLNAQKDTANLCNAQLKGFISDGQEYQLQLNPGRINKIDIIFYPGFTYKIVLCGQPAGPRFEITLIDDKGNKQYSNSNFQYALSREFKFESLFHGQLIVRELTDTEITAKILIGYKKID
jgi:hypothetical protein